MVTPKKDGPPSVPSVTSIANRFTVQVHSGEDHIIPLAAFFNPPLHNLEGSALKQLMTEIHKDMHVLFAITCNHKQAMKDSGSSTSHYVSS